MKRVDSTLRRVEYVTDTLAITAMFLCMVIVATDVFCRYVLNSPLAFVVDLLVLYLLPAIFFMGLPGSYAKGAHVAVDIILNHVATAPRLYLSIFSRVLAVIVFLALAYYGALRVVEAVSLDEIQPGTIVNWPIWPSVLLVPIGCALAGLRAAERLIVELTLLGRGESEILAELAPIAHAEGALQ